MHNCLTSGSFQAPWGSLGECGEQYCLVWESRFLRDLGSAMTSLLDGLVSIVAQEALKYTVLSGRRMAMHVALGLFCLSKSVCAESFSVMNLKIVLTVDACSYHCPGIVAALTWPASLLAAASVIDNPWCVCLNRSAEVGKHLAQVLRSRQQVL